MSIFGRRPNPDEIATQLIEGLEDGSLTLGDLPGADGAAPQRSRWMGDRKKVWPESPDPELERCREQMHGALCRHLVSLGIRLEDLDTNGNPKPKQRRILCSCFVVSINGRWFLVTAGHVLRELAQGLEQRAFRIIRSFLVDYFGQRQTVNRLTPFAYEDAPKYFIDNDEMGLDFGFIPLRDFDRRGLEANGILPISEGQWVNQPRWAFESYWLLGFPKEVTDALNAPTEQGDPLDGSVASVMVSAEAVRDRAELPAGVTIPDTQFPMFIGRVNTDIPFSIRGMSGGPIFGLAHGQDGSLGYTVVALQSRWFPESRIILGCPLSVFAELMRRYSPELLRVTQ